MTADSIPPPKRLSANQIFVLTLASAVVTANAYYIHPIIARVAEDFEVSASTIGLVPAFNQIALALGIFFLLPLGDRMSNRTLSVIFATGQCLSIALMAVSRDFTLFMLGSTLLGFATIVPYLIPTYASKRVDPSELGRVTAILTTGIIAGILLARVGAGAIGEYFGWRTVYYIAAILMLLVTILLPMTMDRREPGPSPDKQQSYFSLIASMGPIVRRSPEVLLSGIIQALAFGTFISVWLALGLHLTSPEMGYGVDVVGYLAALSLVNLVTTPILGAWADRIGARRARAIIAVFLLMGTTLLLVFGYSLWLLMLPLMITNICGPMIDVTGRVTFLNKPPEIRTRLMTIYIVFMFIGGGFGSWAGTTTYDNFGWTGTALLAVGLCTVLLGLALFALRLEPRRQKS